MKTDDDASGFVLAVWAIMLLDWLHRRLGPKNPEPEPEQAGEQLGV